jgi:hypothetical protein
MHFIYISSSNKIALIVDGVLTGSHQTFGLQSFRFFYRQLLLNHKQDTIMKKRILTLGCMAALLAFSGEAKAVVADGTGTANATVTILNQALSITKNGTIDGGNLAFGRILPSTTATGTVAISATGTRISTTVTAMAGSDFGPAMFDVTGTPSAQFAVVLPLTATTVVSGANSMTVDTWEINDSDGTIALSVGGTASFKIGGILHVGANQKAGVYSGGFVVTANYN